MGEGRRDTVDTFKRVFLIVLDSVGIGAMPDAHQYGDENAHTLGHIAEHRGGLKLPHLEALGLGWIAPVQGVTAVDSPLAAYGRMQEASVGKDTLTGHWELMGLRLSVPFKTYTDKGFPKELIQQFESLTGRKVIGNKAASGTAIIEELGQEHMRTGAWIVYTSADSVFQIAAHGGRSIRRAVSSVSSGAEIDPRGSLSGGQSDRSPLRGHARPVCADGQPARLRPQTLWKNGT